MSQERVPETTSDPAARHRRRSVGLPYVLAIAAAWLVTAPRLVPTVFGDHGTYMSVADRLRAGDHLYTDVWDNKDPVAHYVLAGARALLPVGDLVVELLWLALACTAATSIARSAAAAAPRLVGWAATPLVLAGAAYIAGMSHLPGTAVTLVAVALALRGRWAPAGAAAAFLVVTKLVLLPVAGLGLLALLTSDAGRRTRALARLAAGGAAALAVVAALLALRGELGPFLTAQVDNVRYANGPIVDSPYGGFAGHLMRVVTEDGRGGVLGTIALTAAIALLCRSTTHPTHPSAALRRAVWVTLAAEVVVLGLTGFWPHHAQVFAVSSVLALVLAATHASNAPAGRTVVAGLLVAYVLGGAVHPYWYVEAVRGLPDAVRAESSPSPEALALLAHSPTGSYARLGSNDVTAHARGLESWHLACPRFQLYTFDTPATLAAAADCATRTEAVLVDASFAPARPDAPQRETWDAFVASTRARLAQTHDCTSHDWGQLCLLRGT